MPKLGRVSSDRIRELRESRRLTQHDLASALRRRGFGTTQATVSRWESGQVPHSSVLPTLADALGTDVSELFGDDDEEDESLSPLSRDEYALYGELTARIVAGQARERVA